MESIQTQNQNPIHEYEILILERHLDSFGHVNNAVYLNLYEEARWDLITKNGLGLDEIVKNKKGPVLLDLQLTFKAELRNREKIKIISQSRPEIKNNLIVTMDQKMINEKGKVASTLTINVGMMDLHLRKLLILSPEWLNILGFTSLIKKPTQS